jgi:succinate-semialdehyde dehydrogenase / glutarate-semialdehyde dehydrogenase
MTVATLIDQALDALPQGLLIDGQWVQSADQGTIPVEDPATGELLANIADAQASDALEALDVAAAIQPEWAATPPRARAELLRRAFDAVQAGRTRLATLISLEMGKPIGEALAEVDYGAEFLRWFSEETVRIGGEYRIAPDGQTRILVGRHPVGPTLLITPWNFPLAMATRKIAPALAAGCTAILKPAQQTPLTCLAFAQILIDSGLPPGVLSVLTAASAARLVTPLLADGRIRKLSFTGSTEVGRQLIAQCGENVVRTSMELGGNAPFLVFADADLDAAVEGALVAKMRNMGEACTAANRFLIERPIAAEFAARLAERMRALRLGPGVAPETQVGPLIDRQACDRLAALVVDAVDRGAAVHDTSEVPDHGYFFAPTVLEDVDPASDLCTDEIFGPLAPVVPFDDEAEAVTLANGTEYGLVAYVYTTDMRRSLRLSDGLEFGMIGLNRGLVSNAAAPFGGVKHSGLGREGGREGIEDYLDVKYVCVDR